MFMISSSAILLIIAVLKGVDSIKFDRLPNDCQEFSDKFEDKLKKLICVGLKLDKRSDETLLKDFENDHLTDGSSHQTSVFLSLLNRNKPCALVSFIVNFLLLSICIKIVIISLLFLYL